MCKVQDCFLRLSLENEASKNSLEPALWTRCSTWPHTLDRYRGILNPSMDGLGRGVIHTPLETVAKLAWVWVHYISPEI